MMTARVACELLRRVECAQKLVECTWVPPRENLVQDMGLAHEHLEHVRLTLVGAIASHEQLAGRDVRDVR